MPPRPHRLRLRRDQQAALPLIHVRPDGREFLPQGTILLYAVSITLA